MSIEQKLDQLAANMDIALGRINAVHAGLLVLSRYVPKESLIAAADEITHAAEAIHADALATPIPESLVDEMQRVLLQLSEVMRLRHSQI